MTSASLTGLINNAALLMTLALISDVVILRQPGQKDSPSQIPIGVLLGIIGVAIMMNPWEFLPGGIFDTRSILLSVTGLFFGTVPVLITVLMTGAYRLFLGGTGAWTGVAVIVTSGAVGLSWRHWIKRDLGSVSSGDLYLMGLAAHVLMLLLMLKLPRHVACGVLFKITFPVMLIFPTGTVLLGKLIINRRNRIKSERDLKESEHLLSVHLENTPVGAISWNTDFEVVRWNRAAEAIFGYTKEEAIGKHAADLIVPGKIKARIQAVFQELLAQTGGRRSTNENIAKDGKRIMCDWNNTTLTDSRGGSPDAAAPYTMGNERILLVDDEASVVKIEKQMLERLGYRVTVRTGSYDALKAFAATPDSFDLVVTDMSMPNMTGDQLARKLIEIRPDIPVIICTGFSEKMTCEKAETIGVKGFLMKPIVFADLAKTVRKVLDDAGAKPQK